LGLADQRYRFRERFIADIPLEDDPALALMGLGASGKKDISDRHDEI
jgi:hypothetical protein